MSFTLHLISLLLALLALVLALGIVWQSESGLDRSFRFLTISLIVTALNEFLQIISLLGAFNWSVYYGYLSIVGLFFLTLFLLSFTRTLQNVWRRKR
ncbi:MAG: hypothetical protein V1846_03565 [Candidatus Komeilibacteria bacterium]